MPPDQPPMVAPPESVIDFGGSSSDAPERPASRRRRSVAEFGSSLARDRRVVPVAAVLGGVALFASMVSEWQTTTIDTTVFSNEDGRQPIPTDLIDLGGWAAGYLVGVFALVAVTVLVLFGPPPGRRYARLTGLSVGGVLLAMLVALEPSLDDVSRTLGYVIRYQVQRDQITVAAGRGLWCAVIGVLAVTVALYLAGRHTPPVSPATAASAEPVDEASFWRRPPQAAADDDDRAPAAPFDLTVGPATPFTTLTDDDRDKPTGRDGISG